MQNLHSPYPIPVGYAGAVAEERKLCQYAGFSNVTCLDSCALQESILITQVVLDNFIAKPFDLRALAGQVRHILDPNHGRISLATE